MIRAADTATQLRKYDARWWDSVRRVLARRRGVTQVAQVAQVPLTCRRGKDKNVASSVAEDHAAPWSPAGRIHWFPRVEI